MNPSLAKHHDLQQQPPPAQSRSLPPTRPLPSCLTKKKKLFSFLSERNTRAWSVSSSATVSANPTFGCPSLDQTVTTQTYLDDTDVHYLRKSLSKFQNKIKQRQDILKQYILPWFRNKQHASLSSTTSQSNLDQTRSILLRWWGTLLSYVQHINHNERGLYFDCILEIIARSEFIPFDQTDSTFDEWYLSVEGSVMATRTQLEEYKRLLVSTLRYAIEKLNNKAIYSHMISFCAKILAMGFVKIPGLAVSLLQLLPVQNTLMRRLVIEMGDLKGHNEYKTKLSSILPDHLKPMMTWNSTLYNHHIHKTSQHQKSPISLTGNWVRRWKSDDSELFFSFYRHYHVTLKNYIMASIPSAHEYDLRQRNTILTVSPGYMYLASYFAGRIDALLHRRLHSVTTLLQQPLSLNPSTIRDPNNTRTPPIPPEKGRLVGTDAVFLEPGENVTPAPHLVQQTNSILISQPTGKPRPLELATQRYAECLVSCVIMTEPLGLFHDMINVWIRTMVKTTNRMAVESVFCLLDFIEAVILEAQRTHHNLYNELPLDTYYQPILPLDMPFLLHTLQILLLQSDHSITLLRVLSFIYAHFDFLVSDSALLDFMCNRILLFMPIFERLFLHWSRNVRIFFARCMVWRVGRVWKTARVGWSSFTPLSAEPIQKDTSPPSSIDTSPAGSMYVANKGCNGNECWKMWPQTKQQNDQLDYEQCSLHAHILLETMLDSFRHRFMELNQQIPPTARPEKTELGPPANDNDSLSNQAPVPPYISETAISSYSSHNQQSPYPTRIRRKRSYVLKKEPLPRTSITITKKNKWRRIFSFTSSAPTTQEDRPWTDKTPSAFYCTTSDLYTSKLPRFIVDEKEANRSIQTAKSWHYASSNHVYASKTMEELQLILHEYSIWEDKVSITKMLMQNQESDHDDDAMDVPGLALDWPKNWSYSQF